jgi:hypothetical protein
MLPEILSSKKLEISEKTSQTGSHNCEQRLSVESVMGVSGSQ